MTESGECYLGPTTAAVASAGASTPAATEPAADRSLERLNANFARTLQSQAVLLYQLADGGQPAAILSSWGAQVPRGPTPTGQSAFVDRAQSLTGAVLEPLDRDRDAELVQAGRPPLRYAVAAPVRARTGPNSVLIAGFANQPPDPACTVWAAGRYASLVELHVSLPGALDGLLTVARTDVLTGCLTFDAIRYELAREINRSARAGLALSVCFIDLDGFKQVNDVYGHPRGNEVLSQTARVVREGVRSCDTVGRYGGDEFVAILPQTSESEARHLARRMQSLIASAQLPGLGRQLTASVGVAGWHADLSAEQLLALADNALLAAKARSGR